MKRHPFRLLGFRLRPRATWKQPLHLTAIPKDRTPEQGVALIITLILLSVITFMAVTFLVISRSEKGSVSTTTDQTIARLAADAALERAKTEAIARIMAFTNPFNFDLLVSTNYVNPAGYIKGNNSYTNVSYNYPNGAPVSGLDALQNISHLLYNPRVPVVVTNRFAANSNEFRFYLDLNRNGRYDTNGYLPVINASGSYYDLNGTPIPQIIPGRTLSNYFVGDPEWIGGLERVDQPHSSSNLFLYRYAYVVVPASKALDVNYVHNYARLLNGNLNAGSGDGFVRNQGVGTWEINLAGFLTDLNTNYWPFPLGNALGTPYNYRPFDLTLPNNGAAFDDALSFIRFRYNRDWRNYLPSLQAYFNNVDAVSAVSGDFIDTYSRGPIMTNTSWPVQVDGDRTRVNFAWSGSDNPNAFFTTQDYFDPAKTSVQFSNRLWSAGRNIDSYDRYTYYRLLSQLGTDSSWEQPAGKINLNYDNVVKSNRFSYTLNATNFLPWRPLDFFRASAAKILANAGYDPIAATNPSARVSIDHIQVYPTNFYTPSVHQMLQLAANIYDATTYPTNRVLGTTTPNPTPPTVFKPLFSVTNRDEIYISGFEEITNADQMVRVGIPWRDLSNPASRDKLQPGDMIYGFPLIIGARKGFPNFNEFEMQTSVQVTRKLEFLRKEGDTLPNRTNQMLTLTVSNVFGLEAWNSYSNAYPRPLQLRAFVDMFASIWETNEFNSGKLVYTNFVPAFTPAPYITIGASNWPGYLNPNYAQASFRLPFQSPTNSFEYVSNKIYRASTRTLEPLTGVFEANQGFPVPHWFLHLRTRVRYYLIDTGLSPNRVVDFVNLDNTDAPLDIAAILASDGQCGGAYTQNGRSGSMWCTNRTQLGNLNSPTFGILNQIAVGLDQVKPDDWNDFQSMTPRGLERLGAIDFFRAQFGLSPHYYPGTVFSKTNKFYAPFAPSRSVYFKTSWQVNDPLVHYTLGDLVDFTDYFQTNRIAFQDGWTTNGLGGINKRYEPWGGNPTGAKSSSPTAKEMAVKDPMVTRSDDWDFPTNKFPNIGWLGRVHRGTPWQTLDLKSPMINVTNWMRWSGNAYVDRNVGQFNTNVVRFGYLAADAAFSHPLNDRYVLDLFTTAINDNATRGQLSVNQTNLAAWSAVLSGVNVMPDSLTNTFIAPAGVYNPTNLPPVARIVQGIQLAQTNYPGRVFRRLGDVLAASELTVASPFLSTRTNLLNDEVYERIPQQILGLLKGADEPRFVIYSFGQALKPADRSLVTAAGPYSRMCTNYQVVAEVATRSVVRIDGLPHYPLSLSLQKPYSNLRAVVERFNILPPE